MVLFLPLSYLQSMVVIITTSINNITDGVLSTTLLSSVTSKFWERTKFVEEGGRRGILKGSLGL